MYVEEGEAETSEAGDDPFSALGLHPALASADEVRASFRRQAIERHPDKVRGGGDAFDLSALVEARDRALEMVDARPSPSRWAVWVACTVLRTTRAKPIELGLDVDLEDMHRARVKKVCIGVHRVDAKKPPFERTRQTLFVRLVNPSREEMIDEVVFRGAGDDPPAAVLSRGAVKGYKRGDVVVRVRLIAHPTYSPDTIVRPCDLHANASVSLLGHYQGETVRLPHPAGGPSEEVVEVHYPAADADRSEEDAMRRVRTLAGLGLPYVDGDGRSVRRGDLYVFMRVALPPLRSARELEALREWGPASRV